MQFLESDEINDLLKGDDMIRFFGLLVAAAEAIQPLVVKFYDITPLVTPHLHQHVGRETLVSSLSERTSAKSSSSELQLIMLLTRIDE